jgi:Transposase IS116/IS110/IS902 family
MIGAIEKRIIAQHRASEASKRVATIPGIGPLGASAIIATVTDPSAFRSGHRGKIQAGANRSSGRFPSRATGFWWSAPAHPSNYRGATTLECADHVAQVLRIELGRQSRRADEIARKDGQLASLCLGLPQGKGRGRRGGWCRA